MKTSDATFIAEKNKKNNKPVWLYTIFNYNGAGTNLYFCEWDTDITFNGHVYTRFPIKHDFVSSNTNGQVDTIQITVSNVSRLIQAYLEQYEFRGLKVSIQIVFYDQLADATAFLKDTFFIDSLTADANQVVFTLSSKFDVLNLQLPVRQYMRTYCSWKFKGTECGYAGATASCNKTPATCQSMAGGSNYQRFGGFPSVPTENIYVA